MVSKYAESVDNAYVWYPGIKKANHLIKNKGMAKCTRQRFVEATRGTSH